MKGKIDNKSEDLNTRYRQVSYGKKPDMIEMPKKRSRQISMTVPRDWPENLTGKKVKSAINDFFQYIWNNTNGFEKYEKLFPDRCKIVKMVLGTW
jgi:hypothetical protein